MDDGTLAVASRDKSLSLWRSGRLVRILKGHEHCVTALISLPNTTLASGDVKGTIKFWRQGWLFVGYTLDKSCCCVEFYVTRLVRFYIVLSTHAGRCVGTIDSSSGISHSDRIHCFHLVHNVCRFQLVRIVAWVYWNCGCGYGVNTTLTTRSYW